jgi:hypothetical protein
MCSINSLELGVVSLVDSDIKKTKQKWHTRLTIRELKYGFFKGFFVKASNDNIYLQEILVLKC